QHALHDPLHPTAFEVVSDGQRARLSSMLVTGPLMAWLLIPCAMAGGSESIAHLLQWLLVLVTVTATVRVAARLGLGLATARVAGLLVAGCPAVIGMATTSMSDVPAMAFTALGMERFLAWTDDRRPAQAMAVTLAFACASLSRSHALAMPLVAALALLLRPAPACGRGAWVAAVTLVASWLLAAAVVLVTADPATAHGTILDAIGVHWLAAVPLALPWLWARARHIVRDVGCWLVFVAACAFLLGGADLRMHVPLAVATALAFVALADVILDAARRGDRVQWMLGVWLLPALVALPYVQLPCKFLLVSVPAAALLTAKLLEREDARVATAVAGAVIAAGAALGVLIVLADRSEEH